MASEASPELKRTLLEILSRHVGRANRISRSSLLFHAMTRLNQRISDRRMRSAIEELREENAICSSSSDGGYFLPASIEEIDQTIAEYRSRMASFHETLTSLGNARDRYAAEPLEQGRLL